MVREKSLPCLRHSDAYASLPSVETLGPSSSAPAALVFRASCSATETRSSSQRLKRLCENLCRPYGTRVDFPRYPGLRLRLRPGLKYSAPPALASFPPKPPDPPKEDRSQIGKSRSHALLGASRPPNDPKVVHSLQRRSWGILERLNTALRLVVSS
jgi:hypothetical protein